MKKPSLILFLIFLLLNQTFAQKNNTWFAYWNKDKTLVGFKDKTGKIKIAQRFNIQTIASKFDDIMVVNQEKDGKIVTYYLTKKGRRAGTDSLYAFDNTPDCESEGFIRFRDKISQKVGLFNSNGDIGIPADYDYLMPVRNGMIMASKGGRWDTTKISEHNQYPWVGSKEVLIDIHNRVLIDDFPFNDDINFFSLVVTEQPKVNVVRQNYRGANGKYYSFINFDKEFKEWLKNSLLNNLSVSTLLKASYNDITYWSETGGWKHEAKTYFINKNFKLIRSKLLELNSANCQYSVSIEGLNPFIYNSKKFEKYYDNCGESKTWIYPVENVVISHSTKNGLLQDEFNF